MSSWPPSDSRTRRVGLGRCRRGPCNDLSVTVESGPGSLPQFEKPPVMEIVGAAQFVALPRLGLPEIVQVGEALDDYELRELQQQLPPLQEPTPGQPEGLQLG